MEQPNVFMFIIIIIKIKNIIKKSARVHGYQLVGWPYRSFLEYAPRDFVRDQKRLLKLNSHVNSPRIQFYPAAPKPSDSYTGI